MVHTNKEIMAKGRLKCKKGKKSVILCKKKKKKEKLKQTYYAYKRKQNRYNWWYFYRRSFVFGMCCCIGPVKMFIGSGTVVSLGHLTWKSCSPYKFSTVFVNNLLFFSSFFAPKRFLLFTCLT